MNRQVSIATASTIQFQNGMAGDEMNWNNFFFLSKISFYLRCYTHTHTRARTMHRSMLENAKLSITNEINFQRRIKPETKKTDRSNRCEFCDNKVMITRPCNGIRCGWVHHIGLRVMCTLRLRGGVSIRRECKCNVIRYICRGTGRKRSNSILLEWKHVVIGIYILYMWIEIWEFSVNVTRHQ